MSSAVGRRLGSPSVESIHVAPPSLVRQTRETGVKPVSAHALFASFGWTTSLTTSTTGPLTFAHVAPPSVLRKTPAELPAQTTFGSDGAATTIATAPPVGPEELQPANAVEASRKRVAKNFMAAAPTHHAPDRRRATVRPDRSAEQS